MTTTLKTPSYMASQPGPLDTEAALRLAATQYDDAAAIRVKVMAVKLRVELAQMQNPRRANGVLVMALQEILGIPWQDVADLFDQDPCATRTTDRG
jgi:2-oxoglutarate dehydrogenase complex dehydrogenase (E1) component-like enzyme